jgi:SAM-dependent methyltransferase
MLSRTQVDRYPAKMVSRLADRLVERYASNATRILDPFCGSGAVLVAAVRKGIPATGVDVNPIAALFSRVKLRGFDRREAIDIASDLVHAARSTAQPLPIEWSAKRYWFTPATLEKLERLRGAAREMGLCRSNAGMAVLLSFSSCIRLCSKADQRSPKPFISKNAKETRKGLHFDPYVILTKVLEEMSQNLLPVGHHHGSRFVLSDITSDSFGSARLGKHSHVITSPPYINAQDYFRNFKLELYALEGLLPFRVDAIRTRFVGTDRGDLLKGIPNGILAANYEMLPSLRVLNRNLPRLAGVVHRYLFDMGRAFSNIRESLDKNGRFVLVCGDNLIGGIRIRTWLVLRQMLERQGFALFDSFSDPIESRMLAPKRCGHKGLIKEEVISAFERR